MDRVEKDFRGPLVIPRGADETVRWTSKAGLAAAGGILGALTASACCIVPLVLFTLGVSGAWIGDLTALAPYHSLKGARPSPTPSSGIHIPLID